MKNRMTKYVVLSIIIVLTTVVINLILSREGNRHYISMNQGWQVNVNGEVYENVDLKTFHFELLNGGDSIILENKIPNIKILNPVLKLYTLHAEINVFLEGKQIYSYGSQLRKENKLLGYGFHSIYLDDNYGNKNLKIELIATENESFGSVATPQLYNSYYIVKDYVREHVIPLSINLFLIVFGICFIFIACIITDIKGRRSRLAYLAIFSITVGLWSICNYDLIGLFAYDKRVKAYLEYGSLYIAPIFALLYFKGAIVDRTKKYFIRIFNFILGAQILYTGIVFLLQILNIRHFPSMIRVEHILMLLMVVYFIVICCHNMIKRLTVNPTYLVGVIVITIFVIVDGLNLYILRYTKLTNFGHYNSHICLGMLIFIVIIFMDYGFDMAKIVYLEARKELLEYFAYTDVLTEVANRRSCEETFEELANSKERFGILNLDLNNFKMINDVYGHKEGDRALQVFASILKTTFGETGVVGRMGGDEFIVIFKSLENVNINNLLKEFIQNIQKSNQENEVKIDPAFGYCCSDEKEGASVQEIFIIADHRMYEMKDKIKRSKSKDIE